MDRRAALGPTCVTQQGNAGLTLIAGLLHFSCIPEQGTACPESQDLSQNKQAHFAFQHKVPTRRGQSTQVIPEGGKGPQRNPPNWSQNAVCPQRCIGLSGKKGQCYYKGLCFSPVKHSYTWFLGRTVGVTRGISIAITIAISRAARPPVQPPLEGSSNTALLTLLLPIPQDQTATLKKISESAQKTEAGSTQPLVTVYVTGHKYELVTSEVLQGFIPDWSHLTSLCLT